jgi:Terminase RNaseH-like domain
MSAGRLKVFSSLSNWYQEFRLYRRDENGKVVKERDHLMDAMRYLVKSGRDLRRCCAI